MRRGMLAAVLIALLLPGSALASGKPSIPRAGMLMHKSTTTLWAEILPNGAATTYQLKLTVFCQVVGPPTSPPREVCPTEKRGPFLAGGTIKPLGGSSLFATTTIGFPYPEPDWHWRGFEVLATNAYGTSRFLEEGPEIAE